MLLRHLPLIAIAAVALGAPAIASERTTVVYTQSQPETRTWTSGHYEWQGDDYVYVPGHWVIVPGSTTTTTTVTESDSCNRPVVYAEPEPRCSEPRVVYVEPRCEREPVVYTRPACHERVVYAQPRSAVVYSAPSCPPPHRSRVDVSFPIVPIPVPFPFPFPFRHHH